tara:strand:- start:1082 stop:1708 length:627 start_codon:yes stop_codon:yes gene_type:complete
MDCPLCENDAQFFAIYDKREYLQCTYCDSLFLNSKDLPHPRAEKERYDYHENTIKNEGYLEFLQPLINSVKANFSREDSGLDFGSGPTPVFSKLLKMEGFNITTYDPIYKHSESIFRKQYDYIVCCEVIEHFHQPKEEFNTLDDLLKPNGSLLCKTSLYDSSIDFEQWAYKNDFTHSFFYTFKALEYIQQNWNFRKLDVTSELIFFQK